MLTPALFFFLGAAVGAACLFLWRVAVGDGGSRTRRLHPKREDLDYSLSALEQLGIRLERTCESLRQLGYSLSEEIRRVESLRHQEFNTQELRSMVSEPRVSEWHVRDISTSDDQAVAELLRRLDDAAATAPEIKGFMSNHGRQVEVVMEDGSGQWRLVAIDRPSAQDWFVIPCLHSAMGNVPLARFFELSHYTGVDPLKARHVRRPARVIKEQAEWQVVEKGLIDAHGV